MIQSEEITFGQAAGIGWQGNSNDLRQMNLKPCVFNTFEPTEIVELKSVNVNLLKTVCFWYCSSLCAAKSNKNNVFLLLLIMPEKMP